LTFSQRVERGWFHPDGTVRAHLSFPTAQSLSESPKDHITPRPLTEADAELEVAQAAYTAKGVTPIKRLRKSALLVLCAMKFKKSAEDYAGMKKDDLAEMLLGFVRSPFL